MKRAVKQVLGIDVAQDELVVCFGKMYNDFVTEVTSRKTFPNTPTGFEKMIVWLENLIIKEVDLRFVMEATGVYHEKFAYF